VGVFSAVARGAHRTAGRHCLLFTHAWEHSLPDQSFTPAEKVRLEARLTIIEHLLMMQFASDFMSSGGDPLAMARQFSETLRQSLETPLVPGLSPERSALISGEIGDQAHRLGKGIEAMIQRLDK
jgi:hypothetical protein